MAIKIQNDRAEIGRALDYVEQQLADCKLNRRQRMLSMLTAEETIVCLMEHAPAQAELTLSFTRFLGAVELNISAPGEPFDPAETDLLGNVELADMDAEQERAVRSLVLRARSDTFRYKNRAHRNTVQISVKKSDRRQLYMTLGALVLALVLGMALKALAPVALQNALNTYCFTPVKTMFLNALKMVVGPVVFFSIVSCLSQFDNLRDLGKIGAKVMGMYLLTTMLAVAVGLGAVFLLKPGDASLAAFVTDAADATIAAASSTKISLLDTVVNIVPSNFVKPFLEADMLQIIFMAVLCGAAAGMIGDFSKPLRDFFEACNQLFLKITTLIVKVIPLAVLCSMTALVMTTGNEMLLAILCFVGTFLLALVCMLAVYALLVLAFARLNPLRLLQKHAPTMLTNFSLASSNAAMPFNLESCKKLGISSKVSSFSIPLGATVNMDGSCIYMAVAGLFLARVFGVELDGAALFSMVFSIFVLSIGAPGIPGAGLICLSVLLTQLGVPAEALSLVMGIDSLMGMFRVAVNSTGDVAVSLIVARAEGLLDLERYNER
jgi:Na+/H+-dicarboxylate symporter